MIRFAFPPQGVLQYPEKFGVPVVDVLLLVTSVADPESGAFLTPGSDPGWEKIRIRDHARDGKKIRIRDEHLRSF